MSDKGEHYGITHDRKREIFLTEDAVVTTGRLTTKSRFKQFHSEGTECFDDWRTRFVETEDPTEYLGAIKLCGSWANWEQFKANWPHFRKVLLPQWLMELEMRIRSKAMQQLIDGAILGKSIPAAKFIVEGKHNLRKYNLDPDAGVKGEKINARLAADYSADIERINQVEIDNV